MYFDILIVKKTTNPKLNIELTKFSFFEVTIILLSKNMLKKGHVHVQYVSNSLLFNVCNQNV